jgi:hypothetical protein
VGTEHDGHRARKGALNRARGGKWYPPTRGGGGGRVAESTGGMGGVGWGPPWRIVLKGSASGLEKDKIQRLSHEGPLQRTMCMDARPDFSKPRIKSAPDRELVRPWVTQPGRDTQAKGAHTRAERHSSSDALFSVHRNSAAEQHDWLVAPGRIRRICTRAPAQVLRQLSDRACKHASSTRADSSCARGHKRDTGTGRNGATLPAIARDR